MNYLDSTYKQFLDHTKLTDGLYKSVFVQIDNMMDLVANTYFKSITYAIGSSKHTVDLNSAEQLPSYVVDIIKNLFEQFYTLPKNSSIQLTVVHYDVEYIVEAVGDIITIPDKIMFIRAYDLLPYFIMDSTYYDPYKAFTKLFNFMNILCEEKAQPIVELHNLFKADNKSTDLFNIGDGIENTQSIESTIVNLKTVRKDAIDKCAILKDKRETLYLSKLNIDKVTADRSILIDNKLKLESEYEQILCEESNYNNTINSTHKLADEIEYKLKVDETLSEEDAQFLREKRAQLLSSLESLTKTQQQLKHNNAEYSTRIKGVQEEITRCSASYNIPDDAIKCASDLVDIAVEINTLESLIVNYEAQIIQLHQQLASSSSPSDSTVNTDSLFNKLATMGYSKPIVVVMNYLKNWFTYNVDNFTNSIIADGVYCQYNSYEPAYAQIVGIRFVLSTLFRLHFTNFITVFNFVDDRYSHNIVITKE